MKREMLSGATILHPFVKLLKPLRRRQVPRLYYDFEWDDKGEYESSDHDDYCAECFEDVFYSLEHYDEDEVWEMKEEHPDYGDADGGWFEYTCNECGKVLGRKDN
jgi:hypothetical protein